MERITVDFKNGEQLRFDVPYRLESLHTYAIRQHCRDRETQVICVRAWPTPDKSEDRNKWAIDQGIQIEVSEEQPDEETAPDASVVESSEDISVEPTDLNQVEPLKEEKEESPVDTPKAKASKKSAKKKTSKPETSANASDEELDF